MMNIPKIARTSSRRVGAPRCSCRTGAGRPVGDPGILFGTKPVRLYDEVVPRHLPVLKSVSQELRLLLNTLELVLQKKILIQK